MGHFGYIVPEGILGEVATTATNIIRTFVASERINFGQMVEMDVFEDLQSRKITLASTPSRPVVGIAIYQPTHPRGYYEAGDDVSVLTQGDVQVKIKTGDTFRAGDKVYVTVTTPSAGDSDFIFTSTHDVIFPATYHFGTFVDGGTATADNFFRIHFNPNRATFL